MTFDLSRSILVIEASWLALVDALRLELMRLSEQDPTIQRVVEDDWVV